MSAPAALAAVSVSRQSGLDIQPQPDGSLLLRARDGAGLPEPLPLVVEHGGVRLLVRTPAGQRIDLPIHALESGPDQRRVGLRVPADLLRAGLVLAEDGRLPGRQGALAGVADPDPWARHAFARLEVEAAGLVRVTGAWLEEHVGAGLPDPREWSLVHNGRVEPLAMSGGEDGYFDPEDELVFWAEPSVPDVPELGPDTRRDPWCRREVYFLASDGRPGVRFGQETGEIVETDPDRYTTPLTFPATLHLEEDTHFSRLTYVLDEEHPDHHFWTTGIYGGTLSSKTFFVPGLYRNSSQPVALDICLRGLGAPTEEGDPDVFQGVRLFVNNTGGAALEVGTDGQWRNQELRVAHFGSEAFPDHSAFNPGTNVLYLAGMDDPPAGTSSSCMLNWLDLHYQREFTAVDDQLEFRADPSLAGQVVNFEVGGFSDEEILLFKLGSTRFRSTLVRRLGDAWRLRFQDEYEAGTRYVAACRSALKEPAAGERVRWHGLTDASAGAGIVVVLADSLWRSGGAELLAPVLERAAEDGPALVVSDRWIYDAFSHGKVRPHALRDFISRAWATWARPPAHVLLVGDGILSPRETTPGVEPVLPLMFEQVYKWGAASSDDWFSRTADGVQMPVWLTRWPAATPEELANLAAKDADYRSAPAGAWQNSLLLTAGARAQDEGVFLGLTEDFVRTRLADRFFVRRIRAGEQGAPYIGSRDELMALINQGQLLVNYAGHGGGAVWEDNRLFSSDDVPQLDNAGRLAFFTNATCFIASLDYQGSLGRALLNAPQVGAIGVLGSTGLGFRDRGMELVAEFTDLVLNNPDMTVGAALREAKQRLWLRHVPGNEGGVEEKQVHAVNVMNTVLGLPWQRLAVPAEQAAMLENPLVEAGAELRLAGRGARPGGQGVVEVYSSDERPAQAGDDYINGVVRTVFSADEAGAWNVHVPLPASLPGGGATGSLRVWTPTSAGGASGLAWFHPADSLSGDLVWQARLLPGALPGQRLSAAVLAVSAQGLDSLAALFDARALDGTLSGARLQMSHDAQDPQRWSTSALAGPYADSTLVGLRFVLYRATGHDSTTTSWYWIEAPRPDIRWSLAGEADSLGRPLCVVENRGTAAAQGLSCRLEREDGALVPLALPMVEPGGQVRMALPLPTGRLEECWSLLAEWETDAGGPRPAPVTLVRELCILPAGEWVEVDSQLALRHHEAGRLLWARRLPADSLLAQAGRRVDAGPWRLGWLDGLAAGSVEGRLGLAELDSARQATTGLLQLRDGLLLGRVDGSSLVERDSARVRFALHGVEGLGLGRLDDSEAPAIRLEVEGQVFDDGGFVPPRAAFCWSLADAGGLDARAGRLRLSLDGDSVSVDGLSLLAGADGASLNVRFELDGSTPRGQELPLALTASDAAGNAVTHRTMFTVGRRLALEHVGTYPNPFQRETRFVFSLSGLADGARIDIYTVAGRLVRRLEIPGPLINYVETEWDGRDRVGDVVANGVYFYRLSAKGPEGSVEMLGKVARMK